MDSIKDMFNISDEVIKKSKNIEDELKSVYEEIEDISLYNQAKVLKAFKDNHVSGMHMNKTTGYGYNDVGREVIEKIYADVFHTEDSLVRVQFVNGTHTISTVLKALLMPGDNLLAISGRPYDTLCEVIGIVENKLSLMSYDVKYNEIALKDDGNFDIESIENYLKSNKVKVIHIQRSKGYALRKSLCIEDIKDVIKHIRKIDKDVIIMVDNCYGEFVEKLEPTDVGADVVCGSLIKNPGGGLCETGGYIAGRHDVIELCAETLTCPGIGKECGATMDQNRSILQGVFVAPSVVKNAVLSSVFASALLKALGYDVYPDPYDKRTDIVQAIKFGNKDKLIKFIQEIQKQSPIDSHVTPEPWDMPGYDDPVIMAAGTFIDGASIELSADSPIREPYAAYMQGGLTFESAKLAILSAVSKITGDDES